MRASALVFLMMILMCLRRRVAAANERRFDPKDLNEAKAKEAFTCIEEVSCVEKEPLELRKTAHAAEESPEVMSDLYEGILAFGTKAQQDDESWIALCRSICSMPLQERLSRFTDFAATMGNYFQKNKCEVPTHESPYCTAMNKILIEGQAFIDKYTELGVCNNPRRMAKQSSGTLGQAFG